MSPEIGQDHRYPRESDCASRRTAARAAGVDHATLHRWLVRGETASPEGRWAEFLRDVRAAEAAPKIRALRAIYGAMQDDPGLAWKFLERREPGFAQRATEPEPELGGAPIVIQLRFPPRVLPRVDGDDDEPEDA